MGGRDSREGEGKNKKGKEDEKAFISYATGGGAEIWRGEEREVTRMKGRLKGGDCYGWSKLSTGPSVALIRYSRSAIEAVQSSIKR